MSTGEHLGVPLDPGTDEAIAGFHGFENRAMNIRWFRPTLKIAIDNPDE